jgi:hypothetical protein
MSVEDSTCTQETDTCHYPGSDSAGITTGKAKLSGDCEQSRSNSNQDICPQSCRLARPLSLEAYDGS